MVPLAAPIQEENSWQYAENQTATITQLYDSIELEAGTYEDVVEVLVNLNHKEIQLNYYAANLGLVAYYHGDKEGQGNFWQLTSEASNVAIIHPIDVVSPVPGNTDGETQMDRAEFASQSNGSLSRAFDEIFTNLGFIDETISVNSVCLNANGVAVIDFTPGLVAVLNQYDGSEASVINSIVSTLGYFFDTDQVRIEVNGNGMLANTVPFQDGGIYQVPERPAE